MQINTKREDVIHRTSEYHLYEADLLADIQSLLRKLADIDFLHERDLDRFEASNVPDALKQALGSKLRGNHRKRREPYVVLLSELQSQARSLASRTS